MKNLRSRRSALSNGFSLLELSIVVTIVSVVAIMGLEASAAYISSTAYQATTERMATIDAALAKYRYVHGRLPCPAPLAVAVTEPSYYGKQNCMSPAAGGGIVSVTIIDSGSGYLGSYNDVPLTITASSGTGAAAKAIVDPATGTITSISISSAGSGYTGAIDVVPQTVGTPSSTANLNGYFQISGTNGIECNGGGTTCAVIAGGGAGYTESFTNFPVTFSPGSLSPNGAARGIANVDPSSGEIESITITNPGYGYQVTDTPAVSLSEARSGSDANIYAEISLVAVGGLPVRDLNLPLSYALDAYGSKITYWVTQYLTEASTFAANEGAIQLRIGQLEEPCNTNCSVATGGVAYALVSAGKDQRGGYSQRGRLINNCIPRASFSNAIDAQNCIFQGNLTAPIGVTIPLGIIFNSNFNNGSQNSSYFDDIVVAHGKSEL